MTLENKIMLRMINDAGVFKVVGTNEVIENPRVIDRRKVIVKGTDKVEATHLWDDIENAAKEFANDEPNAYSFQKIGDNIYYHISIWAPRKDKYEFVLYKIPQSAIDNESKSIEPADPLFYGIEVNK